MSDPDLEFRLPWALKCEDIPLDGYDTLGPGLPKDIVVGRTREGVSGFATLLGKVAETGYFDRKAWLDLDGAHAVYVMGKRRGGKSHTLGVICEGLAGGGWMTKADERQGALVFDTMNVFLTMDQAARQQQAEELAKEAWSVPHDIPSVHLLRPGGTPDIGNLGLGEVHLGAHDLTAEEWIHTFGLDQFSDVLGHLIFDAYERVRWTGYTTASGVVPGSARFGVGALEACVRDCTDLRGFRDETRHAAIRRFRALAAHSVFDAAGLDLRDLLRPGRVTVLLLRDLPQETRELFVAVLTRRIMEERSQTEHFERLLQAGRARDATETEAWRVSVMNGTPRCWLVIDEAHNYIPSSHSTLCRRPLKRLIDEGRNLGLSVLVATQQPSGLDTSIQRNADVIIIHPMSMEDDIRTAAGMLHSVWPKRAAIARGGTTRTCDFFEAVRSLPRGYGLVSTDTLKRVTAIKVRPRITESGGVGY